MALQDCSYVNLHLHTCYSNASVNFGDSLIKIDGAMERAKELGMKTLALTDHECLSGHIKFVNACKENDIFPILGNEIYCLSEEQYESNKSGETAIPYYHLILIALDLEGWHQLCELSTNAWKRAFKSRGNMRRVTTKEDIERIIDNNKGHVICSSACMGGEIASLLSDGDFDGAYKSMEWFLNVFGNDNYYIEIQPNDYETEQHQSNQRVIAAAKKMGVPIIATTDAHMYSREDKIAHSALKNSRFSSDSEGEDFYATAYMMGDKELRQFLHNDFEDDYDIDEIFENTKLIASRVEDYYDGIFRNQIIPEIPAEYIPAFKIEHTFKKYYDKYPYFKKFSEKEYLQETYAFYQIEQGLIERVVNTDRADKLENYISRINHELEIVDAIDDNLGTKILTYYSTYKFIVDEIWNLGSTVAIGRGSAVSWEINWIIGANQIDPIDNPMLFPERHLNKLRFELPD